MVAGATRRSSPGCGVVGGGCRVPGGWGLAILHHQSVDRSTTGLDVRTLASSARGGHYLHRTEDQLELAREKKKRDREFLLKIVGI